MGLKQAKVRNRTGRNSSEIDKAAFEQIMKDNWDSIREDILAQSTQERDAAKTGLVDKIPNAKTLLDVLYAEDSEIEDF